MNDTKCPACGGVAKLGINQQIGKFYYCLDCNITSTQKPWQELDNTKKQLVSKYNQLENVMKAVDLSIEAINKGCDALIGCQEADDKHISDITAEDGLELLSEYLGKIRFLLNEAKDGKLGN